MKTEVSAFCPYTDDVGHTPLKFCYLDSLIFDASGTVYSLIFDGSGTVYNLIFDGSGSGRQSDVRVFREGTSLDFLEV